MHLIHFASYIVYKGEQGFLMGTIVGSVAHIEWLNLTE
jgi:hypothetical protein